jgi:hypothetical protein
VAVRSYERALIATARPYWDAEAELTRRFFRSRPGKDELVRYLRAAVYKELNPVIGYGPTTGYANGLHMEFARIIDDFRRLDRRVGRRDMLARLKMMAEEFEHYVVLAEVLEHMLGRKLRPSDARQLPEDRKLNAMRRRYVRSDDPRLKATMGLTEGGGSSTFREAAKLKGGNFERRLARAMKLIHLDEKIHYQEAAREAARLVRSPADLARMKKALAEVSRQRVEMRYEMFSAPMPRAELERLLPAEAEGVRATQRAKRRH